MTDNQGNPYAVNKLMATSFPLNVVVMQLACMLEASELWLDLTWVPRDLNTQADALTNMSFSQFDLSKRIEVSIGAKDIRVLFDMLEQGKQLFTQLQELKTAQQGKARRWPKTAKSGRFRHTDPW